MVITVNHDAGMNEHMTLENLEKNDGGNFIKLVEQ